MIGEGKLLATSCWPNTRPVTVAFRAYWSCDPLHDLSAFRPSQRKNGAVRGPQPGVMFEKFGRENCGPQPMLSAWGRMGLAWVEWGGNRGEGGRKNLDIWPSGDRAHRNSSALKPTPNRDDLHPSPRKGGAVWGPQPGMMWDGWGGARGIAR